jgi:hypothetical protein
MGESVGTTTTTKVTTWCCFILNIFVGTFEPTSHSLLPNTYMIHAHPHTLN